MRRPPPPTRSLLWRSLRVYQIYGANTDVGKTIFSTILCRAAHRFWRNELTTFLKPVSTGPLGEADDRHIAKFAPAIFNKTLYQYDLAVSPHLAASASDKYVPSDDVLLDKIAIFASQRAAIGPGWCFVETAGGVHSPSPSGSTQADLYAPLRLPVVLVGDSKLGGISQTISAFESLKIRGYDVESVLLFREGTYQNYTYLADYFRDRHGITVQSVPEPPPRAEDTNKDAEALTQYYDTTSRGSEVRGVLDHLAARHAARIARLESMRTVAHKTIWYPFTQQKHLTPDKITVIDSAHGDYFQTLAEEANAATADLDTTPIANPTPPSSPPSPGPETPTAPATAPSTPSLLRPSFDGSASWWTQGLGHGNPALSLAAAYAAGRYGHVMFAEAVHEPALALAEELLKGMGRTKTTGVETGTGTETGTGKGSRLARAFFSDNGSTGVEVAVKMALRAVRVRYDAGGKFGSGKGGREGKQLGVLGLQGSYHGDTIGAMDCSEPGVYNEVVEWYEGKGYWLEYPIVECRQGKWVVEMPAGVRELGGGGAERVEYPSLSAVFEVEGREVGEQGELYERFITAKLERLAAQGYKFGALMLEPVVLGAGGMLLVDPLFQRTLVKVVRNSAHLFGGDKSPTAPDDPHAWTGLPIIFDEVFTGLYRLGRFSAASFLGVEPDISVRAKLLTGGLVPLSITLASESVFRAFESDDKAEALLHGHSYTAHAVGCQVALESVREMQRMEARGEWDWAKAVRDDSASGTRQVDSVVWSVWSADFVSRVSRLPPDVVGGVWALGSVLAIRLASVDGSEGYKGSAAKALHAALLRGRLDEGWWNVHSRVLGNTLYLMAGQKTTQESIERLERALSEALVEIRK